jgi:hypothetical protein
MHVPGTFEVGAPIRLPHPTFLLLVPTIDKNASGGVLRLSQKHIVRIGSPLATYTPRGVYGRDCTGQPVSETIRSRPGRGGRDGRSDRWHPLVAMISPPISEGGGRLS